MLDKILLIYTYNRMSEFIYYTGIGAKKSGKHTEKEFLKVVKPFANDCSEALIEREYKACSESKAMNHKRFQHYMKHKNATYNTSMSKRNQTKYKKLVKQCAKHKKTAKRRKCTTRELMDFTGAQKH